MTFAGGLRDYEKLVDFPRMSPSSTCIGRIRALWTTRWILTILICKWAIDTSSYLFSLMKRGPDLRYYTERRLTWATSMCHSVENELYCSTMPRGIMLTCKVSRYCLLDLYHAGWYYLNMTPQDALIDEISISTTSPLIWTKQSQVMVIYIIVYLDCNCMFTIFHSNYCFTKIRGRVLPQW